MTLKRSLGRFRLRALANVVCKSPCAGATPTVQAAGRLRKGRSGLGFRVGNRERALSSVKPEVNRRKVERQADRVESWIGHSEMESAKLS